MQNIEEFFINKYWKELERKEQLRSQLALPATIVTIQASGAVYYWERVIQLKWEASMIVLLLCCIVLSITIIATIICLAFSLIGYSSYKALPFIKDFNQYISNIYKYYQDIKDIRIFANADNDVNNAFRLQYEEATDTATFNNEKKSAWLYRAYVMIFVSIIFIIIGFIPFLMTYSDKVQKIEIVNKGGLSYATEQSTESTGAKTTDTTTTTPITTTKETTTSPAKNIKGRTDTPKTKKIKNQ